MSAQHTPGPWRAIPWTCHAATTVVVDDACAVTGKRVIAECESEEDACLIATAPDLLSLLIDAVESFGSDIEGGEADEWLKFARAAIAKATGSAA